MGDNIGMPQENGDPRAVLIVEDSENSAATLEIAFLGIPGLSVLLASSAFEALRILHRPGLAVRAVVTDLNMPHMSGMELISHVRNNYPSISIVAMSGDYQGDAVPAGIIADRFYPKGQHNHNLLTMIASLIATNPARGSIRESVAQPQLTSYS